jgi:hypothetical protein
MPNTHSVRVCIREVTYASLGKNILDQDMIVYNTAYGPGRPEIEPMSVLGADADPSSPEYEKAVTDFKLGQQIELLDEDYVRLRNGGAVVDAQVAEQAAKAAEESQQDVASASKEDLVAWLMTEGPNVQETVNASEGDPGLAKRLLEAEAEAAQQEDREPRKGVVDGLSAVVARG